MDSKYIATGFKIALATLSGLCCWYVWRSDPSSWLIFYGLPGALFAGGVLFPYLRHGKFSWYRCLGLVVISVISYWCAIAVSVGFIEDTLWPGTIDFLAASLVGAAIALGGARLIIPLNRSSELMVTGLAAAVVGGLAFAFIEEQEFFLAFMLWHGLMAVAVHAAENWSLPTGKAK
jgi:hypothetical protein